ncbi:HEAT repeat domain-containing protein [Dictyobacter aurantiacus]|uniref:HEAT repeat domain-containing protein n=1 Tax=Dictyobacter aurantiacus TaxID=1936993 RepID=A0A401ZAD2_9CHLR|nr:HEAT repeat domain-containing protein [Dictyobacter aurantiacus]GCE03815.1 hypothetical protein KDAU_11440 [Dictyobacter aurantiacus]
MERWDARPLQSVELTQEDTGWNVVELESRKNLHSKIHELIDLTINSTLSTSDFHYHLHLCQTQYGKHFTTQLVRSLQRTDAVEREAVVWLLTQLRDPEAIPLLRKLSQQPHYSRAIRLSAALTLAGLGATDEMLQTPARRFYAIS